MVWLKRCLEKMETEVQSRDRYIHDRCLIDFDSAYDKMTCRDGDVEPDPSTACRNRRRLEFRRQLEKIARMNGRILRLSRSGSAERQCPLSERLWPCRPRKKPVMSSEKVLDLPEFNCGFHLNPIDWGANDCLATSVANKVLVGHGFDGIEVKKEMILEYDGDRATAVRWSPDGRNLALGSETGFVLVWFILKKSLILEERCCPGRKCTVTAIEWRPQSADFAWGCMRGKLSVRSLDGSAATNVDRAHRGFICSLKYSPQGNYLCSSGQDAFLRIWRGPNYEPYMEIEMGNPCRAIAWHPWRTGLLAVGEGPPAPGSLSLWNVNTAKLLFVNKMPPSKSITALDFNKLTGELVISQCAEDERRGNALRSEILIFGGPHNVIDSIANISGSVMALTWNADSTKLGAAATDETFSIWNYHEPIKCKRPRGNLNEDIGFLALKRFKCYVR